MSFKSFQKLYFGPEDVKDPKDLARVINALQANVQDSFQPMVAKIQNDSTFLNNVQLKAASNPNVINHTLGRKLLGYQVMLQGNSIVWDSQASNGQPDKTLLLHCSADVTINLLVY